jgi:hypothetical protein
MEGRDNGHGTMILRVTNGEVLHYEAVASRLLVLDQVWELAPGSYELGGSMVGYGQDGPQGGDPASGEFSLVLDFLNPASAPDLSGLGVEQLMAFPNPARTQTVLSLRGLPVPESGVQILDATGRVVRTLLARDSSVPWDLRDERGARVASGVYFARTGASPPARVTVLR